MKKYILTSVSISILPFLAHAIVISDANDIVDTVDYFINAGVWLLVSLAVIYIVWNAVQFIRNAGGEERKKYQNAIMWGIVGLAVILSIWGLVNIVRNTFQTDDATGNFDAQQGVQNLILKRDPGYSSGANIIYTTNPAFSAPGDSNLPPADKVQ